MIFEGKGVQTAQEQPKTLFVNIYLDPFQFIKEIAIEYNLDLKKVGKSMMNKKERMSVLDLCEVGDWGLCFGEDLYCRFGYEWGDIREFDGTEYYAQHSDTQFHATYGWTVRVKFEPISCRITDENSDYYKRPDGKKLLWHGNDPRDEDDQ